MELSGIMGRLNHVMRCPWSVLLVLCLLSLCLQPHPAQATYDVTNTEDIMTACSRSSSQISCIVGCFKCADAFGRKMYDMTSCCIECQRSKALLVDDGPEFCSQRFFTDLAEYGKGSRLHRK